MSTRPERNESLLAHRQHLGCNAANGDFLRIRSIDEELTGRVRSTRRRSSLLFHGKDGGVRRSRSERTIQRCTQLGQQCLAVNCRQELTRFVAPSAG